MTCLGVGGISGGNSQGILQGPTIVGNLFASLLEYFNTEFDGFPRHGVCFFQCFTVSNATGQTWHRHGKASFRLRL